jgi:hypothetical protein
MHLIKVYKSQVVDRDGKVEAVRSLGGPEIRRKDEGWPKARGNALDSIGAIKRLNC